MASQKVEYKPLSKTSFGGKDGEQQNALYSAISTAAEKAGHTGEYKEYKFLDKTPRASLTYLIVKALHKHGYEIKKMEDNE